MVHGYLVIKCMNSKGFSAKLAASGKITKFAEVGKTSTGRIWADWALTMGQAQSVEARLG